MKLKKILFFLAGTAFFGVVAVLVLNKVAEHKIETFLSSKPGNNQLKYGRVNTDIVFGTIAIDSFAYTSPNLNIGLKSLKINDVHYWDFLVNDKIIVEQIYLDSPTIERAKTKKDTIENKQNPKIGFKKEILIRVLEIENGAYVLRNQKKDTLFFVKDISAKIDSIRLSKKTLSRKIPFEYAAYSFQMDSLYVEMGTYHELSLGYALVSNEKIFLQNLLLQPTYSREKFRNSIPYEKDMYHLKIDSFEIMDPSFKFTAKNPVFKSELMRVVGAEFKIYRDKTVRDDPRTKKMYSEMLRNLDLKLDIKKTKLQEVFIQYQELIKKDRPPGTVAFYDLNAVILNLTNIDVRAENFPKTNVHIHTKFMNTSELDVNWQFDISDVSDHFSISGVAKKIPPNAMNPFFVPAMHIKANGNIDAVYFNFHGDQVSAIGDMQMNYDHFSVVVLKENGEEKNKFLTAIANLFVKANPKDGRVVKKDIQVKRDPAKSFWNYLWSCIEKGLLKSVL